eukprot:Rhum_TRINITY_DN4468_c0_g1::Rhum_TRINITY_DN4468_c0_g1_i1::g.14511::m.14511
MFSKLCFTACVWPFSCSSRDWQYCPIWRPASADAASRALMNCFSSTVDTSSQTFSKSSSIISWKFPISNQRFSINADSWFFSSLLKAMVTLAVPIFSGFAFRYLITPLWRKVAISSPKELSCFCIARVPSLLDLSRSSSMAVAGALRYSPSSTISSLMVDVTSRISFATGLKYIACADCCRSLDRCFARSIVASWFSAAACFWSCSFSSSTPSFEFSCSWFDFSSAWIFSSELVSCPKLSVASPRATGSVLKLRGCRAVALNSGFTYGFAFTGSGAITSTMSCARGAAVAAAAAACGGCGCWGAAGTGA